MTLLRFSSTAECYGVLDFGVLWAKAVPEPDPGFDGFQQVLRFQGSGSEGCVKEVSKVSVFDGFRGVRFCSRSFDGTDFWEPGSRNPRYYEGSGLRFPTVTLYFESILLYFESMLLYVESILVVPSRR